MKDKFIHMYLDIAQRIAECSTAIRLKVGAICVKNDRIISIGYNGTPQGWDNICEDENGNTKSEVIHAEMNMIAKLAKTEGGGEDSTVFLTHSPCINCSLLLYQSGIKHIYYSNEYRKSDGIDFLKKCGVNVTKVNNKEELQNLSE